MLLRYYDHLEWRTVGEAEWLEGERKWMMAKGTDGGGFVEGGEGGGRRRTRKCVGERSLRENMDCG